jgi:phosphoglucomutase
MTIELMEAIFGTAFVTPEQCEAVAILHGRQIAAKTAGHRAFARTLESGGDVVRTAWQLAARGMAV